MPGSPLDRVVVTVVTLARDQWGRERWERTGAYRAPCLPVGAAWGRPAMEVYSGGDRALPVWAHCDARPVVGADRGPTNRSDAWDGRGYFGNNPRKSTAANARPVVRKRRR